MDEMLLRVLVGRLRIHYLDFPGFHIADAYKLLYQGCMGPEHAVDDPGAAREWLEREWASIEPDTREGLYQDITVHRPIYRINIRAAKAFGVPREDILEEFIELAREFPQRPGLLKDLWSGVGQHISEGAEIVCDPHALEEFNQMLEKNACPAVHHSEEYNEKNRPAYRLVDEIMD